MVNPNQLMELQKEYQKRAHALQRDFEAKLKVAQAQNDHALMQKLSTEYQAAGFKLVDWFNLEMGKLVAATTATPGAPVGAVGAALTDEEMNIYSKDHCTLDLNKIAYRGDRNQMRKFLNDVPFAALSREVMEEHPVGNAHKRLLARAMRMTPQIAPDLFRVIELVKGRLGLKVDVEVFAVQDQQFNAGCYPIQNGRVPIFLTSGLLEKFTEGELAFVMGHELAHAILDHFRILVDLLLHVADDHLSPAQIIRLRAWERNAELSADRIGLICGQNFNEAASAFFKLSSGIVSKRFSFQLGDYLAQFKDLEKYLKEAKEQDFEDLYSTHPFSPIRLKALHHFAQSELYYQAVGAQPAPGTRPLTKKELEAEIHAMAKLVEPSYLDEQTEVSKLIREFIFLCGFRIARADGVVEQAELNQLASLLDSATVTQGLETFLKLTDQQLEERIDKGAENLNRHAPFVTKLNIVRDLTTIVYADGSVDESEIAVMVGICGRLGINPMFVLELISKAAESAA